ncbi:hypothetical protein L208DRAFT_1387335 [Tricholoma matsutake]|nr:hypothetical protein L208DRAFT_1387335 [Tricholoma matsutake 945]
MSCHSPSSSVSSVDDEDVNRRITPYWPAYNDTFLLRGFRLDTVRDVKQFYNSGSCTTHSLQTASAIPGYLIRAYDCSDNDALCPDPGLPDNLFRGCRISDDKKVVVKAVHLLSQEYNVIRLLSTPPLRYEPMNRTIPVLDFVEVMDDDIVFIVMEEWSSQFITDSPPCCLQVFLRALRQCIEHVVFMHKHNIAHLDISLRNIVTDYKGHYAYIDYETSRRFNGIQPLIFGYRGTEVPPECERCEYIDPYKVDVWALAILMLRACKLAGFHVPELMHVIKPMLHEIPHHRPSISSVLLAFDYMLSMMEDRPLNSACSSSQGPVQSTDL